MSPLVLAVVLTAGAGDLSRAFPFQAEVQLAAEPTGFTRVPLPVEVLSKVQPDLSDVRVVDAQGRLVPFVVRRHQPAHEVQRLEWLVPTTVGQRVSHEKGSPPRLHEQYVYPMQKPASGTLGLSLSTTTPRFIRVVTVEALDAQGRVLAQTHGTVFRLDDGLEVESLGLPPLVLSAATRSVRLTAEGDDGGRWLEPALRVEVREAIAETPTLRLPVPATTEAGERVTHHHLARPSGFVPTRLELVTSTPWFNRRLEVHDGHGARIAASRVLRLPGTPRAERLEVPLPATSSESLEVVVFDEDSGPLEAPAFTWVIEQPELVLVASNAAAPLRLLYGGARTRPARFDTAAFARLPEVDAVSTLRALGPNPRYERGTPLAAFQRPAAALEVARFEHQAPVSAWPKEADVVELALRPEHAATMARGFGDVRLLDAQGRQWPFVLQHESADVTVRVDSPERTALGTGWPFELRGEVQGVTLLPAAGTPYFSRPARLHFVPHEKDRLSMEVWSGFLTHNPSGRGASTQLVMPLSSSPTGRGHWRLDVEDGSDAPLPPFELRGRVVVPRLSTVAPPGEYRVVWGDAALPSPSYDLERVRGVLAELKPAAATVGAPQGNPSWVKPSLVERTGGATRWLFWGALVLAVLVLGALGVKVARAPEPTPND